MISGTQISYYFLCHRKLWLFSNGIHLEQDSDLVYEGRLIHETSYPQRSEKYEEIEIEGIKIDYYDPKNKVIHEVKKSDKMEPAHEWQLKYYIYVLEQHGITGVKGLLEYPKLRQTTEINLSDRDREEFPLICEKINSIITSCTCPPMIKLNICKQCSYFDFCYISESYDM
jgi:CRISPR-associated exonuclease Cas4